jgi:cell wall-associated NlpC family hydrolase
MEVTTMNLKGLLLLLTLTLVSTAIPLHASAAYSYEVPVIEVIQTVNFREAASTSSNRIRYLQVGETLDIIRKPNSYWYEATDSTGTNGFVSSSTTYIKLSTKLVYPEPNGEAISTVSFRTGPSTSNDRIRYLYKGERFWVIEKTNDYWYKIMDRHDVIGYVSSGAQYISTSFVSPIPNPPNEQASPAGEPNGQVVAGVNFRAAPSTDAERIRYLAAGELLWIVEKVNDYWYKAADENNILGYVSTSSKYIDTVFSDPTEAEEETYVEEPNAQVIKTVSFRTGPSTSNERIRYIQAGEPLWILKKMNSYWYEAKDKNGTTGYVSTNTTYLTTTFIEEYKTLDPADAAELVINAGMKYLGTPYEFGSSRFDTTTFDCSDFIRQIFIDALGLRLPGDSRQQAEWVKQNAGGQPLTDWRQLQRGDLMFFMEYKGYKASSYTEVNKSTEIVRHVGMYLGNGQVLHTYSVSSGGVLISNIAGTQWDYRFLYGGQALQLQ